MPIALSRSAPAARLLAALVRIAWLAPALLAVGCDYPTVSIQSPHGLVVRTGDSATVTVDAHASDGCSTFSESDICPSLDDALFEYAVQHLPPGVSARFDYSLRSPSTPGAARITFDAATTAQDGLHEVALHVRLAGNGISLGRKVLGLHVLPAQVPRTSARPVAIAAGGAHSVAALSDGTIWSWGNNVDGQLGIEHPSGSWIPVEVPRPFSADDIEATTARHGASSALTADGEMWAWGRLYAGFSSSPERLTTQDPAAGPQRVRTQASGRNFTLAIADDGTLWISGIVDRDDSLVDSARLTRVEGLTDVVDAAGGRGFGPRYALAVTADGKVWAWGGGSPNQGLLAAPQEVPAEVAGLTAIKAVAAGGEHALALADDGTVWAWGRNTSGQLGDGTMSETVRREPAPVPGLSGIEAIEAGRQSSMAVGQDGTLWVWGYGALGLRAQDVGSGVTSPRALPLDPVDRVSAGARHTMVLLECGQIRVFGYNEHGQLGLGAKIATRDTPVPLLDFADDGTCSHVGLHVALDGRGTITDDAGALDCDETICAGVYDRGATVTLTAVADEGAEFAGWEEGCQAAAPQIAVVLSASTRCVAVFRETIGDLYLLTVDRTGEGRVRSSDLDRVPGLATPRAIDCGSTCDAIVAAGATVTLTAEPAQGFQFAGWSGDCGGGDSETTVTIDARTICVAEFAPTEAALEIGRSGNGAGTVVSVEPPGIDCGADCGETYPLQTEVTLTATPAAGSVFAGWSGDCAGESAAITIVLDADRSCVATFDSEAADVAFLSIDFGQGDGTGRVTSSPPGIDCVPGSESCTVAFAEGDRVELTAAPDAGSVFVGFNGDPDCVDGVVTLSTSKACFAIFDAHGFGGWVNLTFTVSGPGRVSTGDGGIDCPDDCGEIYPFSYFTPLGAVSELVGAVENGSQFAGWGGDCASIGGANPFLMSDLEPSFESTDEPLALNCSADFVATSGPNFTIRVDLVPGGTEGDRVFSEPAGIDCVRGGPNACEASFTADFVALRAERAGGPGFITWTGICATQADGDVCVLSNPQTEELIDVGVQFD